MTAAKKPAKKATKATKPAAKPKAAPKAKESKAAVKPTAKAAAKESAPAAAPAAAQAESAPPNAAAAVFAGKVIVLTGALITMKRDEAQKLLAAAGAKLGNGVTKQTTLLIYGEKAGSKLAAAKKLNIPVMTEAEMVAHLTKSPAASASLGGAAEKIAEAQAAEKKRMKGVQADIDASNAAFVSKHGMTLPTLLLKYLQLFSKRPDVSIIHNDQGRVASNNTLLKWHGEVPAEWLALRAEIGSLHFKWAFKEPEGEVHGFNRINLVDPEKFRWWPQQDYQKKLAKSSPEYNCDFKEEATFDDFVDEGRALLSYGKKEKPAQSSLIFDNTNDCIRHPLGGIFTYLTNGARAGFTWYWQSGPGENTTALYGGSLPRSTPPATLETLLQKQGLSEAEARAMHSWLGEDVVILLHGSLTPEGAERMKLVKRFPGANNTSKRNMDISTIEQLATSGAAIKEADWKKELAAHAKFIKSGGEGGEWTLLEVAGLPMNLYQGATASEGKQLVLRLKSIKERSAKGANLTYADLSGACCDGVDFSGADLSHSLLTDSLFRGANFKGAKLENADLSGARLQNANFQGADLTGADFEATDLTGADFRKAILTGAKFPGAILNDVKP